MIDSKWLDKYGFVKTKKDQDSTGNPYLYTVIYDILHPTEYNNFYLNKLWKSDLGVLWRTPENTYGQNSWDEYLALAVDHIYIPGEEIPRSVIWSSIKKFGFMQNSFEKGDLWKSWMWRFPQVWLVMIASAFPVATPLMRGLLQMLVSFQRQSVEDASSIQLQFLERWAILKMGNKKPMEMFFQNIKDQGTSMKKLMTGYYDEDHPTLEALGAFENNILKTN